MSKFVRRPAIFVFMPAAVALLFFGAWGAQPTVSQALQASPTRTPSLTSRASATIRAAQTAVVLATVTPSRSRTPTRTPTSSGTPATPTSQSQSAGGTLNWQQVSAGTRAQLGSVSCPGDELCLAAGGTTMLKSSDGGRTWSPKQIDSSPVLLSQVYCQSELKCLALYGTSLFSTGGIFETGDGGETWTLAAESSQLRDSIVKVSCPESETCYGISEQQIFRRTATDTDWQLVKGDVFSPPPPPLYLIDLTCPSAELCLAIGANRVDNEGIILRISKGGSDVARVPSLSSELSKSSFEGVICQNDKTCLVVGRFGVIAKSNDGGTTWERLAWTAPKTEEPVFLSDMSCPSALVCFAVGGNPFTGHCCGVIIKTIDGGRTWTNEKMDLPLKLLGVSCTSETTCVAVGDRGLIVRLTATPLAAKPTATTTRSPGAVISSAVMAAGVKGFTIPYGITDTFPPDAREIHTVINVVQALPGTRIKIIWTAVNVGNAASPNTKLTEYSGTVQGTGPYDFYFRPGGTLPEGTYKVDLYVDDKLERTLNFYVRAGATLPPASPTASPVGHCPLTPTQQSQSTVVESITLAKEFRSSTGEPVDVTSTFEPSDTFHAVVRITDAPENTRLKAIWFATDVGDAGPCNYQFPGVSETSPFSGTTTWDFTLNHRSGFPVGLYRIEIQVNDQFAMEADFSVR